MMAAASGTILIPMRAMMALTSVCDQSRAYMLKEINYALETIIILCHTLLWSPDNDAKYVPKSQRPNHYAWLTQGIKQITDTITEWEVRQKSRKKMHARKKSFVGTHLPPVLGTNKPRSNSPEDSALRRASTAKRSWQM